ncbi:DNA-repair protein UmuC-like protein [Lasiodiplodia theobromae]|uniref:DNA-repair protein UmuC-like protein n=1 Tax=Lasiodiplodia theobromae TaxID=45133 RepID=UPI0015C2DA28|nr:DNA-repair protein UmuC-like protein [Lasiodiplodia theobromae]KAF4542753.1 DNA-repair protein UmuC-like protein [Lasiodiplodia theobromae]
MSSSQPFIDSSPLSTGSGRRRKSNFTYRHLSQLSAFTTTCPLRVVAHIDLDAFYAQCEMVRLGVSPDQPLAVQQWQGLIAINYPARAFGLSRHVTAAEAQKLCPDLVCQHVATWKEGDERWAYHDDAFKNMATHKVSLDPYRMESRKILALIKDALPKELQRVEKASIDEVFMDLSAQVHSVLLERYPELAGPPPYDDPTENLPRPPTTALDWQTDHLIDLDASETEDDDPDWDDVAILIGSEIVRDVRARVFEELKYTCSGGVARNKMLAKLGSGHKKPNQQTVVRNRAVQNFLSDMKFTKIRNLGGKLGDEVVAMFNTDTVKDLLEASLDQLQRLGDGTGIWLYDIIRGNDTSEVNSRMQIKSMLSAKSFRPSINNFDQGLRWLRIFCADIFSRCVEEGVLENRRRPKTINLHHRQGQQTRSKQSPIPQAKTFSEEMLFVLAKGLLASVVVDGRAWPCSNLSLSVGGFEDGITGNKGISGFLVRGAEAKAMFASEREASSSKNDRADPPPPQKRRRVDESGIQRFFGPRQTSRDDSGNEHSPSMSRENSRAASEHTEHEVPLEPLDDGHHGHFSTGAEDPEQTWDEVDPSEIPPPSAQPPPEGHFHQTDYFPTSTEPATTHNVAAQPSHQTTLDTFVCERCSTRVPVSQQGEHSDYHVAKDLAEQLQAEDRASAAARPPAPPSSTTPKPRGRGRPAGSGSSGKSVKGPEKGQMKLAFGKG